jgi:RNA polymerase sigma-70 factor (ECF subfamily)
LPEPVLTSEVERPDTVLQRAESVTLAFMVLFETLSPEERAVFLLKDIFEYAHSEISGMLGITIDNSRQLLHRAKARLAEGRPRLTGTASTRRAAAERLHSRDASALTSLLAGDVGMWSDGGGKVSAAKRPLVGRDEVLNFLLGVRRAARNTRVTRDESLAIEDVNSEPALVVRVGQRLESLFVLSIEGETISAIRVVRNPEKLARIDRQLTTHSEGSAFHRC